MFGTVLPIPPPPGTNLDNARSPDRVDTIPNDNTNNTGMDNVTPNVVFAEDLPQLLDTKGGSHVINVCEFDVEDFTRWKDRTQGLLIKIKDLRSIIISCLLNDVMKSVIKCTTAQSMCNGLILAQEGPSDTTDIKIAALRLKFNSFKALEGEKVQGTFTRLKILLNDLENKGVSISQAGVNATFVNNFPRKWLNMNQTQRANNSIKNDSMTMVVMVKDGEGYTREVISVEYEWKPPQCMKCKVFGHTCDSCPKRVSETEPNSATMEEQDDEFI
ncbi:hypothetical protein Tco_0490283 [Tanacetum coccineum]